MGSCVCGRHDWDTRFGSPVEQKLEQVGPIDGQTEIVPAGASVIGAENRSAAQPFYAVQLVDRASRRPGLVHKAEDIQAGLADGLDDKTGADRTRRVELVEQGDRIPAFRQQGRGGQTAYPAACDADLQGVAVPNCNSASRA